MGYMEAVWSQSEMKDRINDNEGYDGENVPTRPG